MFDELGLTYSGYSRCKVIVPPWVLIYFQPFSYRLIILVYTALFRIQFHIILFKLISSDSFVAKCLATKLFKAMFYFFTPVGGKKCKKEENYFVLYFIYDIILLVCIKGSAKFEALFFDAASIQAALILFLVSNLLVWSPQLLSFRLYLSSLYPNNKNKNLIFI